MESLDRGIVAVRKSPEEVFISWRLLGTDPAKTGFNLYRGNQKLNKKPLTLVTNYTDKTATDEVYTVKAVVKRKEEPASASCKVWQQSFLKIPLNRPAGGTIEKEVVSNRPDQANRPAGNTPADNRTDQPLQDRRQYTYAPGDATEYRLYTLMHDPVYRLGVAWQNVVYNQPPHLGFYIGDGLNNVPIPNIFTIKSPAISSK